MWLNGRLALTKPLGVWIWGLKLWPIYLKAPHFLIFVEIDPSSSCCVINDFIVLQFWCVPFPVSVSTPEVWHFLYVIPISLFLQLLLRGEAQDVVQPVQA